MDSLKSTDQTTPSNTQEVQSSPREIHAFDGRDGEFRRMESSNGASTDIRRDSRDRRDGQGGTDTTSLSNSPREDGKRRIHQGGSDPRSSRQSGLVGRGIESNIVTISPSTIKFDSPTSTPEIQSLLENKAENKLGGEAESKQDIKLENNQNGKTQDNAQSEQDIITNNKDINPFIKALDSFLENTSHAVKKQTFENKKIPNLNQAMTILEKLDNLHSSLTQQTQNPTLDIQLLQAKKLVFEKLHNIPADVLANELQLLDSHIAFVRSSTQPIQEFGTNYAEYYHNPQGAIAQLLRQKQGQVAGAFHKEGLGDIDLVWGNKDMGLEKILNKHSDDFKAFDKGEKGIIKGLDEIIQNGNVVENAGVKTIIYRKGDENYRVGLSKGWKNEGENEWIITSYKYDKSSRSVDFRPSNDLKENGTDLSLNDSTNILPQNSSKEPTTLEELKQIKKELEEKRVKLSDEQPKDLPINTMIYDASKALNKVFKKPRYKDQNIYISNRQDFSKLRTDFNNNLLDEKLAKDLQPIFKELEEKVARYEKQYVDWLDKDKPLSAKIQEINNKIEALNPSHEIKTTYEQDLLDYPQAIKALEEFKKTKPKDHYADIIKDTLNKLNDIEDTKLYKNKKDIQKALSLIESKKLAINKLSPSELQKLNIQEQIVKEYEEKLTQNKQVLDSYNEQRRELENNFYLASNRLYDKINDTDFLPHLNPKQEFKPKDKLFHYKNTPKLLRIEFDLGKSEADFIKENAKNSSQEALRESREKLSNLRDKLNEVLNIEPIQEFGTNYAEFYSDGANAIKKLLLEKQGQVARAFHKEGLGDIDLVWGEVSSKNKGYGLAHIRDKHPDFDIHILPQIVEHGEVKTSQSAIHTIIYGDYKVGLSKGFHNKGDNHWVVTAYEDTRGKAKTFDSSPTSSEETLSKTSNDILPQTHKQTNIKDIQEANNNNALSSDTKATNDLSQTPQEIVARFEKSLSELADTKVLSEQDFETKKQKIQEFLKLDDEYEYAHALESYFVNKANKEIQDLLGGNFDTIVSYKELNEKTRRYRDRDDKLIIKSFNDLRHFKNVIDPDGQNVIAGFYPLGTSNTNRLHTIIQEAHDLFFDSLRNLGSIQAKARDLQKQLEENYKVFQSQSLQDIKDNVTSDSLPSSQVSKTNVQEANNNALSSDTTPVQPKDSHYFQNGNSMEGTPEQPSIMQNPTKTTNDSLTPTDSNDISSNQSLYHGIDMHIDDKEFERLNNVSQFDIAKVYKNEYNTAINTIINSALFDEKKAFYLKKYKELFLNKLRARGEFIPANVAGFSNYKPNTKATKRLSIQLNQINNLFEQMNKDIHSISIFKNIQESELHYYKDHNIVVSLGYTKDIQPRINIHFITKPRQQIIYALKKKGFVWNHLEGVWSAKVEKVLQNKEWLENRLGELLGTNNSIDLSGIDINDITNKTKILQAQRKQERKDIANALKTDSRLKELYAQKEAVIKQYGGQDKWGQFPWGNYANANEEQSKVYKKLDDINDKIFSRKEELQNQIKAQQNFIQSNPYVSTSVLGGVSGLEIDYNQDGKNNEFDIVLGALGAIVGAKGLKYLSSKPQVFKNVLKHYFPEKEKIIQEGFEKQTQKEKRGIYNVAYNNKKATLIKQDLQTIDGVLLEKGRQKNDKGYGADHIAAHLKENSAGYVTQNELLNLGQSIREYILEYKEPFIEKSGARVYEWKDKEGVRFRLVVGDRSDKGATTAVATEHRLPLSKTIITFYSDRNLKQKMSFKNPKLQSLMTKLKNKLVS